ncbi:MAG: hypothetical protein JXA67_12055 [Micromonosporaceae bacterium]|nr:hypothetical protein [Micromonosporaceae bacterium]
MRHLGSLIAGLVVAPAVWLLLAIGQPRTATTFSRWIDDNTYDTADLIGPIAYLAVAGLLFGLVATLRISPLGPMLAGVCYLAVFGVMFVDPLWGLEVIPDRIDLPWVDAQPHDPIKNGTLAMLALCLLATSISVKRWRQWPAQGSTGARAAEESPAETLPAGLTPALPALPALPAGPGSGMATAETVKAQSSPEPGTTMVLTGEVQPAAAKPDPAPQTPASASSEPSAERNGENVPGSPWAGLPKVNRN